MRARLRTNTFCLRENSLKWLFIYDKNVCVCSSVYVCIIYLQSWYFVNSNHDSLFFYFLPLELWVNPRILNYFKNQLESAYNSSPYPCRHLVMFLHSSHNERQTEYNRIFREYFKRQELVPPPVGGTTEKRSIIFPYSKLRNDDVYWIYLNQLVTERMIDFAELNTIYCYNR